MRLPVVSGDACGPFLGFLALSCSARVAVAGGRGFYCGLVLGGQGLCLPLGPAFLPGDAAHDSLNSFMGRGVIVAGASVYCGQSGLVEPDDGRREAAIREV